MITGLAVIHFRIDTRKFASFNELAVFVGTAVLMQPEIVMW